MPPADAHGRTVLLQPGYDCIGVMNRYQSLTASIKGFKRGPWDCSTCP